MKDCWEPKSERHRQTRAFSQVPSNMEGDKRFLVPASAAARSPRSAQISTNLELTTSLKVDNSVHPEQSKLIKSAVSNAKCWLLRLLPCSPHFTSPSDGDNVFIGETYVHVLAGSCQRNHRVSIVSSCPRSRSVWAIRSPFRDKITAISTRRRRHRL